MKQIVNISLGQAGIQLTESLIELYLEEHQLNPHGSPIQSSQLNLPQKLPIDQLEKHRNTQNLSSLFQENVQNHYKARFLLVDTEPDAINALNHSLCSQILNTSYFITGKQSANTYARGYYSNKYTQIQEKFSNSLQKITETCDNLQSFILNHAIEGGTGSGATSLIAQILTETFPKITKTNFIISYEPANCNTPVAPYNTTLGLAKFINFSDLCIMTDNFSLNTLFDRNLDIKNPNYQNLNNLISQLHSSYTLSMRHTDCVLPCDIKQMQTNLVCYPRIHWVIPSFVPLIAERDESSPWSRHMTPNFIVERSLDGSSQLLNQQSSLLGQRFVTGRKISSVLLARGQLNECQLLNAVDNVSSKQSWVDFSPLGVKVGISRHKATQIHLNEKSKRMRSSIASLASTMDFNYYLSRINSFYDKLYSKRAFVHWYLGAGMDEMEMMEAREDMAAIQKDYEEWYGGEMDQDEW